MPRRDGTTSLSHREAMVTRRYVGVTQPSLRNPPTSLPGTVTTGESIDELLGHAENALASVLMPRRRQGRCCLGMWTPRRLRSATTRWATTIRASSWSRGGLMQSMQVGITIEEGLLVRLDALMARIQAGHSDLLARGVRMVLAAERG